MIGAVGSSGAVDGGAVDGGAVEQWSSGGVDGSWGRDDCQDIAIAVYGDVLPV